MGVSAGCYLHGLFTADAFRATYLSELGARSQLSYAADVEDTLDALARHLDAHMDLDLLLTACRHDRRAIPAADSPGRGGSRAAPACARFG